MTIASLLLAAFALSIAWARLVLLRHDRDRWRNATELVTKRALDTSARCTLISADVMMLEHALARRDASLAEVRRQLGVARTRAEALDDLERLARGGYGPSFTQEAARTCQSVEVFGPRPEDFARAVTRVAAGCRRVAS